MAKVRAHVRIWGDVQGVFYRSTARDIANAYGITGWIRNRPDGSVEAVLEGDQEDIQTMIEWCQQGPPGAEVEGVDVAWEPYNGEYSYFSVR